MLKKPGNKNSLYNKLFERNIGLISKEEQKKLQHASIGIAGTGSDGGLLAERLARFGIGRILLADPDSFELNNLNRQFSSNIKSVGKNKALVIAKELSLINPNIKVIVLKEGINDRNVQQFVKDSDVIVDEIDYFSPVISVMLAKEARKQTKYLFTGANIGWGASILCFSPKGTTFEEYFQYDPKTKSINLLRYSKKIPKYFNRKLAEEIINKKVPIPIVSSSVGLVASLLSSEIIFFLLKKRRPVIAPKILFFDAFTQKIEIR